MEKRSEKIGKVTLDLEYYTGEDLYSEGSAEDRLLEIVKSESPASYNRIIAQEGNWSALYHLSDMRGNIADFIPIQKSQKVLEIGAGCGAVTGTLAKNAGHLTCIELSYKRSLINAYRNKEADNIDIMVGNFEDIEPNLRERYDYIFLIGVLEYAGSYIHAGDPYLELLRRVSGHLAQGGEIVVAIENKYGLKYMNGCREDHTGRFYDGMKGYHPDDGVRTFSREGMLSLAKRAGLRSEFYYPYPDYKLPTVIFSDERLPHGGELVDNIRNFDADRFVSYDEAAAFDESVREGIFREVANSFLIFLSREDRIESFKVKHPLYSRHSDERDPRYQVRTDILEDGYHKKYVMKYPKTQAAQAHLLYMYDSYVKLAARLKDSSVKINRTCIATDSDGAFTGLQFEYLKGRTLEEILSAYLTAGRTEEAEKILHEFAAFVRSKKLPDVDLIFSNIIITPDGTWNITDYEWMDEDADPEFVLYRSVRYFLDKHKGLMSEPTIYAATGLDLSMKKEFEDQEAALQRKIAGDHISLSSMYSIFGKGYVTLEQTMHRAAPLMRAGHVKFYFDTGRGFSEEETAWYDGEVGDDMRVKLEIPLPEGTKAVRLDPLEAPCMLRLVSASVVKAKANGFVCGHSVIYATSDPQLVFAGVAGYRYFKAEYVIQTVDAGMFEEICDTLKTESGSGAGIPGRKTKKKEYEEISAMDRAN